MPRPDPLDIITTPSDAAAVNEPRRFIRVSPCEFPQQAARLNSKFIRRGGPAQTVAIIRWKPSELRIEISNHALR